MNKLVASTAALGMASTTALAAPTATTIITNGDVNTVLKDQPLGDHTIRVEDVAEINGV